MRSRFEILLTGPLTAEFPPAEAIAKQLCQNAFAATAVGEPSLPIIQALRASMENLLVSRLTDVITYALDDAKGAHETVELAFQHGDFASTPTTFHDYLWEGGWDHIVSAYPELIQVLHTAHRNWMTAVVELGERLGQDLEALGALGWKGCPSSCSSALSDYHDGGRCVLKLGDQFETHVYYKPRSLAIEVAFGDLYQNAFQAAFGYPPPLPTILNRGDYGWVQDIGVFQTICPSEARDHCLHLGFLVGVLFRLRATDIHSANVVMSQQGPVLVDAETVLHPEVRECRMQIADNGAEFDWMDSILRTQALPHSLETAGGSLYRPGLIPAASGRLPVDPPWAAFWSNVLSMIGSTWQTHFIHGVTTAGRIELAPSETIKLKNASRRLVKRDTSIYLTILRQSFTPRALRNGRQSQIKILLGQCGAAVSPDEEAALVNLDVPKLLTDDAPLVLNQFPDNLESTLSYLLRSEVRLRETFTGPSCSRQTDC